MELVTVVEAESTSRVLRELAVLGLFALAAYLVLSLASHDAGRAPNLGGPIGASLAQTFESIFGYPAYVLAALMACLARLVWAEVPVRQLVRETAGGAILLFDGAADDRRRACADSRVCAD